MPINKKILCLLALLSTTTHANESLINTSAVNAFRVSFADMLTPRDAKVISLRAANHINHKGHAGISDFSRIDSGYLLKDGFVFCMTLKGVLISHPVRPHLVGRSFLNYQRYGQPLFEMMINVANTSGEGWVEYKWPYPGTSELRQKKAYVVKNKEDFFCGVTAFK